MKWVPPVGLDEFNSLKKIKIFKKIPAWACGVYFEPFLRWVKWTDVEMTRANASVEVFIFIAPPPPRLSVVPHWPRPFKSSPPGGTRLSGGSLVWGEGLMRVAVAATWWMQRRINDTTATVTRSFPLDLTLFSFASFSVQKKIKRKKKWK